MRRIPSGVRSLLEDPAVAAVVALAFVMLTAIGWLRRSPPLAGWPRHRYGESGGGEVRVQQAVTAEAVRQTAVAMLDGLVRQLPSSRRYYSELAELSGDEGWRERVESVFRAERLVLTGEYERMTPFARFRELIRTLAGQGANEEQVTCAAVACLAFAMPGNGDEIARAWRELAAAS